MHTEGAFAIYYQQYVGKDISAQKAQEHGEPGKDICEASPLKGKIMENYNKKNKYAKLYTVSLESGRMENSSISWRCVSWERW